MFDAAGTGTNLAVHEFVGLMFNNELEYETLEGLVHVFRVTSRVGWFDRFEPISIDIKDPGKAI